MADQGDRARAADELFRRTALAAHKSNSGESEEVCRDCGDDIPEARRKAVPGVTRCVECQSGEENGRH